MKVIRKTLALVIALCMMLSVCAFADDVTWEDYQNYLIEAAGGNAPDLAEFQAQVAAIGSWEEMPLDESPWDMFYTTLGLSTWDEFVAAGGVGKQSLEVGSMAGGSGEASGAPTGEPSGAPSGEAPAASGEASGGSGEASGGPGGPGGGQAVVIDDPMPAPVADPAGEPLEPAEYEYLTNYTNRRTPGNIYVGHDETGPAEIALDDTVTGEGYTSVYAHGADADVTVSGSLTLTDDSNGRNASDFSGQGSATVAYDLSLIHI